MEWFRLVHGVNLRLSWIVPHPGKLSELDIDMAYRERVHPELWSVYCGPGATFDPARPNASPYVCTDPSVRILLDPNEDFSGKIAEDDIHYSKHLSRIVDLHDRTTGYESSGSLPERLQVIVQRCLG